MVYLRCIASATKATCVGRTLTCGGIFSQCASAQEASKLTLGSKDSPNDELRASKNSKWKVETPSGLKDWRTTGVEEDNKSHIKMTYLHSKTLYKDLIPWDQRGPKFGAKNRCWFTVVSIGWLLEGGEEEISLRREGDAVLDLSWLYHCLNLTSIY